MCFVILNVFYNSKCVLHLWATVVPTHMGRKIVKLKIKLNGRERGITTPQSLHWNLCKKKVNPLAPAKWTDYEHFILQQIVDIVVDDDSNPDYSKIHKLFLNVLSYKNSNINLPHLSLTVIKTKVNYILRDRTVLLNNKNLAVTGCKYNRHNFVNHIYYCVKPYSPFNGCLQGL